jgi:hypothetical protein
MPAQIEVPEGGHHKNIRYQCPHCGSHVHTLLAPLTGARANGEESWWAAVCTNAQCRLPSLLKVRHLAGKPFLGHHVSEFSSLPVQVIPAARPVYTAAGVPQAVVKDLTEALGCEAEGFYVGAVVVGRRALQAAVRERLATLKITPTNDKLFTEIDALPDGVLPPQWKETAHEVRHLGNDGAHSEPVSAAESAVLLAFTKDVLHQLYVLPAGLAAAKAARAAKKGAT